MLQGEITQVRSFVIDKADEYTYHDPIDHSVAEHQGIRFLGRDGSRIVYRLSGIHATAAPCNLTHLLSYSINTTDSVCDLPCLQLRCISAC